MSTIVGVHGIAAQYTSGPELEAEWLPALKGGLKEAGHRQKADSLRSQDLRVSFYGSLFRKPGELGEFPPYRAADLTSGEEIALLTALYDEAVTREPNLGEPTGALGPLRVSVQVMAERLLQSRTFAGLGERALVGNFKQVTRFLKEPAIKEKVLGRVREEVDDSTRILIGHSLGSVVAYEFLCHCQPKGVELFLTLGSPLGIPNVIFHQLTPTPVPVDGPKPGAIKRWVHKLFFNRQASDTISFAGAWPGAVKQWVNVADPDDVVALRKKLAGLFPPPRGMGIDPVADKLVDNGDEEHAIRRYLNAAVTGAAIATAL